jgi:hypothetical protein
VNLPVALGGMLGLFLRRNTSMMAPNWRRLVPDSRQQCFIQAFARGARPPGRAVGPLRGNVTKKFFGGLCLRVHSGEQWRI